MIGIRMQENKALKEFSSVYREVYREIHNDVRMRFFYERGDDLSMINEHEGFNKQMCLELEKITTKSFQKRMDGVNLTNTQSEYYLKGLLKEYNSQLAKYGNEVTSRTDQANGHKNEVGLRTNQANEDSIPSIHLSEQIENQPAKDKITGMNK